MESRFKLIKILSNTLQGRIYLAVDQMGEFGWVAVKETWRELINRGRSQKGFNVPEDFENEKAILWDLSNEKEQSEGYSRCIGTWETTDCCYMAMEYCEGGELWNYIRNQHSKGVASVGLNEGQQCQKTPSPWSLCVQSIFRQLVSTVSWLHSKGIAHLDLSLENTMLASVTEPKIKIIDFGLAKRFKPNQKFKRRAGKLNYMSPEVNACEEYLPEKADVWSLGIMLFIMLVGGSPFKSSSLTDPAFCFVMQGQLREILKHWQRLSFVSEEALDVIEKILRPEDKRITMKELRSHPYVGLDAPMSNKAEESTTQVQVVDVSEKKSREATNKDTISPVVSNPEESTMAVENQLIPKVETEKAVDLSKQLRSVIGVEKLRAMVVAIEQAIDDAKKKFSAPSVETDDSARGEGVVVDESRRHDKGVEELKKLLQVAKKRLESKTT